MSSWMEASGSNEEFVSAVVSRVPTSVLEAVTERRGASDAAVVGDDRLVVCILYCVVARGSGKVQINKEPAGWRGQFLFRASERRGMLIRMHISILGAMSSPRW